MGKKKRGTGDRYAVATGNPLDALAGAASYFSVVAYPEAKDSRKREKFMEALIAWRIKCCIPYLQRATIRVPPEYSRVRKLHGPISKGFRCLERRLTAASMAWSICVHGAVVSYDLLGLPAEKDGNKYVKIKGNSSVNQAAGVVLQQKRTQGDEEQIANVKHRIWAESLPVLHLAIALFQKVESLPTRKGGSFKDDEVTSGATSQPEDTNSSDEDKLLSLLLRADWLLQTTLYAESLRTFLPCRIPTFQPDKAVRLLPPGVPLS